jgi:hypothetical protein
VGLPRAEGTQATLPWRFFANIHIGMPKPPLCLGTTPKRTEGITTECLVTHCCLVEVVTVALPRYGCSLHYAALASTVFTSFNLINIALCTSFRCLELTLLNSRNIKGRLGILSSKLFKNGVYERQLFIQTQYIIYVY